MVWPPSGKHWQAMSSDGIFLVIRRLFTEMIKDFLIESIFFSGLLRIAVALELQQKPREKDGLF